MSQQVNQQVIDTKTNEEKDVVVMTAPVTTSTFVMLSEPAYDFIESKVRETFKNACIVWIERVSNPTLEDAFEEYRKKVQPSNVRTLFHGTSEDVARIILAEGFDPSKCKVCAHGLGIYFSTRAEYSKTYCWRKNGQDYAFMIVADVVTGKTGQGHAYKPIPPEYDSVTDNINKPDMYIINKREAALPRYLVAFYPDMVQ